MIAIRRFPAVSLALVVLLAVVPGHIAAARDGGSIAAADDPSAAEPIGQAQVDDRLPVTVTVSSGVNPSLRNEHVPFTVTVDPVPDTGRVTVYHGGNATSVPIDPSGTTIVEHRFVDDGEFTVHACFGLSLIYQDTCSTAGVSQRVLAFDTTTSLDIDPTSLYLDEALGITVAVDPPPDDPAHVVIRRYAQPILWTIPLDPVTGIGHLDVAGSDVKTRLTFGANDLIAQFGGTDHMNQSMSAPVVVYGKRDTAIVTLEADPRTFAAGDVISATATIVPVPPIGTIIDFFLRRTDSDHVSGYSATDADGSATATIRVPTNWPVGEYSLEARFRGDIRIAPGVTTMPVTLAYLDERPPIFGFILDGPDPRTSTRQITVRSSADGTGSPVVGAELSNDGISWTAFPYSTSLPWTLTEGDGMKTVWLRVTDAAGNVSGPGYFWIRLDTPPVVTAPAHRLVNGTAITGGRTTVRLSWTGSDQTSAIDHYELAQSTDGGAWATVSRALTSPALDRALAHGHSYRFRLRAADDAGNLSEWVLGPTFRLTHLGESSSAIRYSGTWTTATSSVYWGGKARSSSRAGSRATLTFTGRAVELVSRKGPTRGKAQIYVNGVLKATIDLYAASFQNQRVVWTGSWASSASRTVSVRVLGTSGRARVDVDAFVVVQ